MEYATSTKPWKLGAFPGAPVRPREPDTDAALGCVVVRRIADHAGREWRVRQFATAVGVGLFFRCEVRGIRPEVRQATAFLDTLSDADLVSLLDKDAE